MMSDGRPFDLFDAAIRTTCSSTIDVHSLWTAYMTRKNNRSGWRDSNTLVAIGTGTTLNDGCCFVQRPHSLRTALEVPTPYLTMVDLLKKADELYITLLHDTLGAVATISPDISAAVCNWQTGQS